MQSSLPGLCCSSFRDCSVQPGKLVELNNPFVLFLVENCGFLRPLVSGMLFFKIYFSQLVSMNQGSDTADANGWAVLRVIVDLEGNVSKCPSPEHV